MKKLVLLFALVLLVGCRFAYAAKPHPDATARCPNILFILADDLGYGDVGCYNPESKVPTPNLDQLSREGMLFTDAHSPSTVCTPSRYSLLTGRMAFRTGMGGVFTGVRGPCLIEEERLTLPQMLREKGYETAMFGKWHIGMTFLDKDGTPVYEADLKNPKKKDWREPGAEVQRVRLVDYSRPIPDGPVNRGFDKFFGTVCCPTTDWFYAFVDGDRVPVPPTELLDRDKYPNHVYSQDFRRGLIAPDFDPEEVDLLFLKKSIQFLESHIENQKSKIGNQKSEIGNPKPFFLFHSTQAVHLPSLAGKDFQGKTQAGPHGDFIFEFDHVVGELMETLDRLGLADNTLVMVSSDNGPETAPIMNMRPDYGHDGARPWRGMKRDQWEGGHRVPLIVRWPGKIEPGSRTTQTACLTDVMATCAEIVGAKLPNDAAEDSYSILPVLLGVQDEDTALRPYTLHQTIRLDLAIRRGPWKYLDHQGSGGNRYTSERFEPYILPEKAPGAPGQLYNLDTDPGETTNLYFEHPEIVKQLKDQLEESRESGRSVPMR